MKERHMDLDIPIRTHGRAEQTPTVLSVRALSSEEVAAYTAREAGTKPTPLQRVTARHRQLARLLASGMTPSAAAHAVGLTASRVSILQGDATFQELIRHCELEKETSFIKMNERLAALGEAAVEELQDRLDDDDTRKELSAGQLMRMVELTADRTGFGPKKTEEHNVTLNFGDRLAAARERAKKVESAPMIDAKATVLETSDA